MHCCLSQASLSLYLAKMPVCFLEVSGCPALGLVPSTYTGPSSRWSVQGAPRLCTSKQTRRGKKVWENRGRALQAKDLEVDTKQICNLLRVSIAIPMHEEQS